MTAESIDQAKAEYTYGQDAFERGRYREAVEHLEQALTLARATTPLGGEVQIWLVNAYAAVGRQPEALALCEALTRHPYSETRKLAKDLLYVLQAPSLQKREDWNTKIPDLANLAEDGSSLGGAARIAAPKPTPRKKPTEAVEPIDLSTVNTRDNFFLWIALGAIALLLLGLAWLS